MRMNFNRALAGMLAAAAVSLMSIPSAQAAQRAYVVKSDRGGYLHDRLIEIENLRRSGTRVQIQGRVCYSTCTMFLGLPHTCVNPQTIFGFHGPSRSGKRLAAEEFDYFSRVMADFYPGQLRSWYLEKGRNRISGVYKIKGSEIIKMGLATPCTTT